MKITNLIAITFSVIATTGVVLYALIRTESPPPKADDLLLAATGDEEVVVVSADGPAVGTGIPHATAERTGSFHGGPRGMSVSPGGSPPYRGSSGYGGSSAYRPSPAYGSATVGWNHHSPPGGSYVGGYGGSSRSGGTTGIATTSRPSRKQYDIEGFSMPGDNSQSLGTDAQVSRALTILEDRTARLERALEEVINRTSSQK